ncbi:MAG: hypothetical protein R3C31_11880 [Hyphomonadaceae bacterium]
MSEDEIIARYAPIRASLLVVGALVLIAVLASSGLLQRWTERPLTASVVMLMILTSAWMALPVGWQMIRRNRAALWIEGSHLRTAFWSCELAEVQIAEIQQAEEISEVVVRLGKLKTKRIDASLLEGSAGQVAVRLNHAVARRRCA